MGESDSDSWSHGGKPLLYVFVSAWGTLAITTVTTISKVDEDYATFGLLFHLHPGEESLCAAHLPVKCKNLARNSGS